VHLDLIAVVVREYDLAIDFFTGALGFELVEDSPALTSGGGRPKRWVVVRPPGAATGLFRARYQTGRRRILAAFSPRMAFFSACERSGSASTSSAVWAGSYHG
jgi:catechol 2,3-dioxygenase-like lactoylglutathione lyase family enzyme